MSAYAQNFGYFFNSNAGDRTYNAESFEEWLKPFFLSGVFNGGLEVTAQSTPDMTVNVAAGYANLDGKLARWTGTNVMTLSAASGVYDRIDTIVLRRDNTNRTISIEVVTGSASLNPSPTPPTRDADTYELVLAQILVGVGVTSITAANITDTRMDSSVCGWVAATVDQIDFDQIKAQFDGWLADTEDDFMDWFDAMKGQLSEDAAGHLQLEIDDINASIGSTALPTTAQTLTGAIAELSGVTDDLAEEIGIVVNGDQSAVSATTGQYIILKNSTITGCTDGLYTAAKAIPANTTLDSTYLTSVSGGGLNALNGKIPTPVNGSYYMYGISIYGGTNGYIAIPFPFADKILAGKTVTISSATCPGTVTFSLIGTTSISSFHLSRSYTGNAHPNVSVLCEVKIS